MDMFLIYYVDKLPQFISCLCNKYVCSEYDSYHLICILMCLISYLATDLKGRAEFSMLCGS